MFKISVKSVKSLRNLNKQVKFAVVVALNDSAFALREAQNESIGETFTTRNRFTEKGTRVEKARKTRPVASVGTVRPYMRDHVTGGTRAGRNAVPMAIRKNPKRAIRQARWVGKLRKRHHRFYRLGRVRILFDMRRKKTLWVVPDVQQVKPRWKFGEVAVATHSRVFPRAFPGALKRALATAK